MPNALCKLQNDLKNRDYQDIHVQCIQNNDLGFASSAWSSSFSKVIVANIFDQHGTIIGIYHSNLSF